MNDILPVFDFGVVGAHEVILRVSMALVFGMILGLERDQKNKPIDFRAYMIVGVTSCILAIMAQELFADYNSNNGDEFMTLDLAKIISGVMTGIGFLGAGAIIKRSDDQVVGTATGASIWAASGIGLTLGFGYYFLGIIAFVAIAFTLIIGGILMEKFGIRHEQDKPTKAKKKT